MDRDESPPELAALEGSLDLRVEVASGRIADVRIDGTRPVRAARALEGRPVDSALAALPLLYQLCGTAQSVAGLRAAEAAFDCSPGPAGCAARSLLVAFEALEQSLWRILLDWPRCIGDRANEHGLLHFRRRLAELQREVFADSQWNRLGGAPMSREPEALIGAIESLALEVDRTLFGGARGDEALRSRDDFEAWFRDARTPASAVFDWVATHQLEGFGGAGIQPADGIDAQYISERMSRDDGWAFCSLPDHHGEVRQTGALARLVDSALVRELHREFGYGLMTQLAARLLEVTTLLGEIREQLSALSSDEAPTLPSLGTGRALGSVDTARGRLFHWVEVRDGKVERYRTLAPTEWNFHPRGPLAQGLAGAPANDLAMARRAVDLLVTAIDPCVGTRIEIAEA